MEQSERLKQLLLDIDAQIKAERARRPPGDRRRVHQGPPQGMDERRAQPDRRGRARAQQVAVINIERVSKQQPV